MKCILYISISSVQSLSCVQLFVTMDCSTPCLSGHRQLPEFTQTHVHWVSDAIQPSHSLSSPLLLLPSVFLSIRVFSSESALHIRWPKYWSFTFSISPSNEQSGLVSFRIVRFDLFAVQIQVLFNLTWTTPMASVLRSQIHSLGFHEKWKIQFLQLSFLMLPHCLWAQILSHFIWPCLYFFSHAFYNFPLHITGLSCLLVVYLLSFTFHELCCFS